MSSRKSVSPDKTDTSKPRKRSDASAKAGKAVKGTPKAAAKTKAKPAKKAATSRKVAAAALGNAEIPLNEAPSTRTDEALTPKQELFSHQYLANGMNGTRAYMAAFPGTTASVAASEAYRLLRNPKVHAFIAAEREKSARKLEIKRETLLREAWQVATADARELVSWQVQCCRYCYGEGYRYQRTAGEMERDREAHAKLAREMRAAGEPDPGPFDEKGGTGWDPRRDPNDECPECFGEGHGGIVIADTSKLSPAAAALYAGIKQTKDGLQVQMHSKLDAAEKLFKHLGLYEKDNDQKSKGFGQALAAFANGLHERAACKLPIAPAKKEGQG